MKPTHLTDEQMFDLLNQNQPANDHVRSCAACAAEVHHLRASLADFRTAATRLAAAGTPALAVRSIALPARRFAPRVWGASLATATALLAVSIALLHPVPQVPVANRPTTAADTAVSDDALLDGIQQDLSTSIPPSLEPLAVPAASGESSTHN